MVRTLGFHPKNRGSIPLNLILYIHLNVSLKLFFFKKTENYFKKLQNNLFIPFLNLYLFILNFFIIKKLSKSLNLIRQERIKFKTILKSPMAQRQWSQEQYFIPLHIYKFTIKLTLYLYKYEFNSYFFFFNKLKYIINSNLLPLITIPTFSIKSKIRLFLV